jgi:aconitate hydratase
MSHEPIIPTRESATHIYQTMERNLATVRRRLHRPLTQADKVLLGHLADPESAGLTPGESYLPLRPDRVVFQDVLGQTGMLQFMQTGRDEVAVPATIHCDHLIVARSNGPTDLRTSLAENDEVYAFLRAAAARYGLGFWEPGAGIIHQVVLENYAFPGQLLIGTDSHTPNAGGLGACAVGVGGADAVDVLAGLPWELLYPKRIAVHLTGALRGWSAPKDVILFLAGQLGVSGATNAVLEYIGPGARTLSATGKATIANMGAELGATTSLFPADPWMSRYLEATGRAELVPAIMQYAELLSADPEAEAAPRDHYDRVVEVDLSTLEPHVVGPHSPDRARPLSALAAEVRASGGALRDSISTAILGSCTNSSYEDLSRAADVATQARAHGLGTRSELLVAPGSARVREAVARDGQLAALEGLGATVLANACGPCIGQWNRQPPATGPDTIVTSFNRNFAGRNDGNPQTMAFIASPEIVTALAVGGRLSFNPCTDTLVGADGAVFRLEPPAPAPDIPPTPVAGRAGSYVAPPATRGPEVIIDPRSERLQRLAPWSAWDGRDFEDLALLVRVSGRTTTDQISPAGHWLRWRGHLERFSANFLLGARNAWTGEVGRTTNVLTQEPSAPIAEVARAYRAAGIRWVVVGDSNYGEGSSREHAALSPRLLGGVAVLAKSFARIHETNLKKQGLLALTFVEPADAERLQPGDRLSLRGLDRLAPGKHVECSVRHADGRRATVWLRHSYSASQIAWFRAGSALNAARGARGIGAGH